MCYVIHFQSPTLEKLICIITISLIILNNCSGYMSPEYAMEGRYSTKSDVYSYGVLLLEIIAGKRNTDNDPGRASPNLIGYVS